MQPVVVFANASKNAKLTLTKTENMVPSGMFPEVRTSVSPRSKSNMAALRINNGKAAHYSVYQPISLVFNVVTLVKLTVMLNFYLWTSCFVAFACKNYHIVCCYWLVANSANLQQYTTISLKADVEEGVSASIKGCMLH